MSGPAIVALGEAMIEFNQTRAGEQHFLQGFGGDTSNAAIAASRHGAASAYLTKLGGDEFGRMLLRLWRGENVDASGVRLEAGARTGIYFVTHGERGHEFSYYRAGSAASAMTPADLDLGLIRGAKFLHVSGISQAISASARETVAAAIAAARAAGVAVCYDSNLRLALWPLDEARAAIRETIAKTDYFLPSIEDARAFTGLDAPDAILDWCRAAGARAVLLKLGPEGVVAATRDERKLVQGVKVETVDATGAGDCFAGALLARLVAGDGLIEATRYANAAAALSTTGYGAVAPIPRPDAVRKLLAASG